MMVEMADHPPGMKGRNPGRPGPTTKNRWEPKPVRTKTVGTRDDGFAGISATSARPVVLTLYGGFNSSWNSLKRFSILVPVMAATIPEGSSNLSQRLTTNPTEHPSEGG